MKLLLALPIVLGLAACTNSSGPDCGGTAPVSGAWEYHGATNNPPPGATSVGTLEFANVDGCEFGGTLSIDETPNGGGPLVSLAGPIFGVAASATGVTFDAQFTGGTIRSHIAEVIGDSIAGTWIEGSGTSAPRGTFWAKKTP